MRKRIPAFLLSLLMSISMVVFANAADGGQKDVVVNINGISNSTKTVYGVSIEWEEPTFTFSSSENVKMRWDPESHEYVVGESGVEPVSGSFDKDSVSIKVYNHSNDKINVNCFVGADSSAASAQYTVPNYDINLNVSNTSGTSSLPAAAENSDVDSVSTEYVLGISGSGMGQYAADLVANGKHEAKLGTVVVSIGDGKVSVGNTPAQAGVLTYNGSRRNPATAQSPSWIGYDPDKITLGGDTEGINAGSYTATFTQKDGYKWSDGTTVTRNVVWYIEKAKYPLMLCSIGTNHWLDTSKSLKATFLPDETDPNILLSFSSFGDGSPVHASDVTVVSSNTDVMTVSNFMFAQIGYRAVLTRISSGTTDITVTAKGQQNYKTTSITFTVVCE